MTTADELSAARLSWRRGPPDSDGIVLGIAASFVAEPLTPYLAHHLRQAGVGCRAIAQAPYNQLRQSCLSPTTAFGQAPDVVILLCRLEDLAPAYIQRALEGESSAPQDFAALADNLVAAALSLQQRQNIPVVVGLPPLPYAPSFDGSHPTQRRHLKECHAAFLDAVETADPTNILHRLDLAALLADFGRSRALDWRKWYLYRQPYTEGFWWQVAARVARLVALQRRARKKCLVLDCDNTLWGGVVGEEGIEKLALGEDFPGNAYRDFQRQALALMQSGVFLALASKNEPTDVWRVFDQHDGMVLKRSHISLAEIGWHEKAESLVRIAQQLNIGLDSIVFIDDSPLEIEKVRTRLPQVTCLLAPEEAADLPLLLMDSPLFSQLRETKEDKLRVASFRDEQARHSLRLSSSPEDFQKSLQLVVKAGPIGEAQVARVAQLINKTNQFNLTTRRRSEAEVLELLRSPKHLVMALDLEDRFGAYGIVGVAIAETEGTTLIWDSFLLSCRALGRGVEKAFAAALVQEARQRGLETFKATFQPTDKNAVAADFLASIGFQKVAGHFEASLDALPPLDAAVTLLPLISP